LHHNNRDPRNTTKIRNTHHHHTTMPRGYLRRNSGTNRKIARGGSSKHNGWYKTPLWRRQEKSELRRVRRRELQTLFNDELFDVGYWEEEARFEDHDDDDHEVEEEEAAPHTVNSESADEQDYCLHHDHCTIDPVVDEPVVNSMNDDFHADDDSHQDDSFFIESGDTESRMDQGYSFCDDSYREESCSSFSLIGGSAADTMSRRDSVDSSCCSWEVVGPLPSDFNSMMHSKVPTDDDTASCGSTKFVGSSHIMTPSVPCSLRLVVPKKCAICLSERNDVIRLMHKCQHPEACISCLRTHYITNNILQGDDDGDDVSRFPLTCFWPGCNRHLRDVQIRRLANSSEELSAFYLMAQRVKNQRKEQTLLQKQIMNFQTIQPCTHCTAPIALRPAYYNSKRPLECSQCQTRQAVTMTIHEIKSILEALGQFLVNCPKCYTPIYKDGGCDDMTCVCGNEFSFRAARRRGQFVA